MIKLLPTPQPFQSLHRRKIWLCPSSAIELPIERRSHSLIHSKSHSISDISARSQQDPSPPTRILQTRNVKYKLLKKLLEQAPRQVFENLPSSVDTSSILEVATKLEDSGSLRKLIAWWSSMFISIWFIMVLCGVHCMDLQEGFGRFHSTDTSWVLFHCGSQGFSSYSCGKTWKVGHAQGKFWTHSVYE